MKNLIIPAIILLAAFTRLMPHPPNFTPIIAMGLFGGASINNRKWAILIPLLSMLLADIFLGFHMGMFWVYSSILLITLLGSYLRDNMSLLNGFLSSFMGSFVFFIVTNFGVWFSSSFYSKTIHGLLSCYVAGIPFFINTLAGSIFYAFIMFYGYKQIKKTFIIMNPNSIQ